MNTLEAELYAATHRGNPGDIAFYTGACRGAANVLELGAGYGRLLPSLSRVTRGVVGLERDPALLRAARKAGLELPHQLRQRIELLRGDMQRFQIDRQFERILLPYSGLYCLTGKRQVLECFRSVYAHLKDQGRFLFDVWCADDFHRRAASPGHRDDQCPIASIWHRDQNWDVWESSRLRRRGQRLDVLYTYGSRERGNVVRIPIQQRYSPSTELIGQLERAGFRVEAVYGDFRPAPFRPSSPYFIVCAMKSDKGARRR